MKCQLFVKCWLVVAALVLSGLIAGAFCTLSSPSARVGSHPVKLAASPEPLTSGYVEQKSGTELTPDPLTTLLVLATLDGTLTAVDRVSGDLRWVSRDEPMIKVPTGPMSTKAPYFLPDPKTGSLYVMGRSNNLKKLPFTIPQLVAKAPCRNSEGLLYTGRKMDYWLYLNPNTGEKSEMPSYGESTCPAKGEGDDAGDDPNDACTAGLNSRGLPGSVSKTLLIGKSEYTLSMVEGHRKWNVTYHHYSSVDMSPQSIQDYDLVHFTSPSTGTILTYDRETGQLLWQRELDSPVIAVYTVDCSSSNFISVPFNPIAPNTLNRLKSVEAENNKPLSPTMYIGESDHGVYAVPALVDDKVFLIPSNRKKSLPPLLEGPSSPGKNSGANDRESGPNKNYSQSPQDPSPENDFILLGYYELPETSGNSFPRQIESSVLVDSKPTLGAGQFNESDSFEPDSDESFEFPNNVRVQVVSQPVSPNKVQFPPFPMPSPPPVSDETTQTIVPETRKEMKPMKIVFTTALISVSITLAVMVVGFLVYVKYHAKKKVLQKNAPKQNTDIASDSDENKSVVIKAKKSADGSVVSIGKICFYPSSILGKGCEGTFVYKGKFEDREVAVKRILPECFAFADREVDLLKESDHHPNVIRYFCTEADEQFRYIALELCEATLSDWVEGKFEFEGIDPIQVLREATDGLAHLHSLQIVHRDIKPANVLLTVSSSGAQVKTMISDFGLCKKITNGRMSFSRRSGGIPGTDGWIAPEVIRNIEQINSHRMSYSVDVFSLGCVYYFVLTMGEHPFGEPFFRQSNIVNGESNILKVKDHAQGVYDLINVMISSDSNLRPPLEDILYHPMFWSKEKILAYFLDVSDRIEKENDNCDLLVRLERDGLKVVRNNWRDHICPEVAMDLRKYRTYTGEKIRDLLRALRNKKSHYRELTPEAQTSLGHIPDQFVDYWISRFPDLLPYTWLKFESLRKEPIFSKYYPKSFSFNTLINGDEDLIQFKREDGLMDSINPEDSTTLLSPGEKSPGKLDKNFWRSKSQFKYNKWRRQQQNTNVRENPTNFISFGTTRYTNLQSTTSAQSTGSETHRGSPDTDNSWRNPVQ